MLYFHKQSSFIRHNIMILLHQSTFSRIHSHISNVILNIGTVFYKYYSKWKLGWFSLSVFMENYDWTKYCQQFLLLLNIIHILFGYDYMVLGCCQHLWIIKGRVDIVDDGNKFSWIFLINPFTIVLILINHADKFIVFRRKYKL